MVVSLSQVKLCRCCRRNLPADEFYASRSGQLASRCKHCHGLGRRSCHVCRRVFLGGSSRKYCSQLCHDLMNAPTFFICRHCGQLFGPVGRLSQKFCSKKCVYAAASTGRKTVRKTIRKARSAQSLLRYHVEAGHIERAKICEACGAQGRRIEGAHFNYDEPLRVRWLCVSCHRRWDKREPKQATYAVPVVLAKRDCAP